MVEAMKTVSDWPRSFTIKHAADALYHPQEHVLRAPQDGVVSRVIATVGELVPEGKVLVTFEEADTSKEE